MSPGRSTGGRAGRRPLQSRLPPADRVGRRRLRRPDRSLRPNADGDARGSSRVRNARSDGARPRRQRHLHRSGALTDGAPASSAPRLRATRADRTEAASNLSPFAVMGAARGHVSPAQADHAVGRNDDRRRRVRLVACTDVFDGPACAVPDGVPDRAVRRKASEFPRAHRRSAGRQPALGRRSRRPARRPGGRDGLRRGSDRARGACVHSSCRLDGTRGFVADRIRVMRTVLHIANERQ